MFDTAPSYGASEEVAGRIARETRASNEPDVLGHQGQRRRRGGACRPCRRAGADRAVLRHARASPKIDLIQVHNLGDVPTQLAILKELKKAGPRALHRRHPTTRDSEYAELDVGHAQRAARLHRRRLRHRQPRGRGRRSCRWRGSGRSACFVYAPFGRTRLFRRVGDRPLPDWAAEFDATTWAQFFLKWIVGHPAVTVVTPATSQASNMLDNLGGGVGRLPDEATRRRMAAFIDALPQA